MKLSALIPAAALFALAACGGGNETTADQLEEAAEQSGPAAVPILENAADRIEDSNAGPAQAEAAAQQALQRAGNAQAQTLTEQQPAQSMQAQPNRSGQQTPPPKVPTGPGDPATRPGNSQ